ncbi:MAG: hypothetical protein AB7T63_01580 [Planctomycetota bacterium]
MPTPANPSPPSRLSRPWGIALGLGALVLLGSPRLAAGDGSGAREPAGPAPQQNFSDVHATEEWVLRAFREAERASVAGRHAETARLLQTVVEATTGPDGDGGAAPYVLPVHGTASYEGAWIVARHAQARGGPPVLDALASEHGATAARLLARAVAAQDREGLADVAWRFLPLGEGRRAALLLADLALERADRDEALEWCQALEDLEAVSAEPEERVAPWRRARIVRHARALAATRADLEPLEAALTLRAARRTAPDRGLLALPLERVATSPAPRVWMQAGGDATRAAPAPDVGPKLRLAWCLRPGEVERPLADGRDPEAPGPRRPSSFLPPRAVVVGDLALVSDGLQLHGFDLATGRERVREPFAFSYLDITRRDAAVDDTPIDRRARAGWIEGHALAAWPRTHPDGREGWLVVAAVPDGRPWSALGDEREERLDHMEAFFFDGSAMEPLWQVGGGLGDTSPTGLDPYLRLYSSPLLYRGLVWVAGSLPSKASRDRVESWLVALDPDTGAVVNRTHVGSGTPVRPGREDEVMPTAPAGAAGRIVYGTALGLVAAVSARDGRVAWAYRYDRDVEVDRAARGRRRTDTLEPRSIGFLAEPPRLALERCALAPTDGRDLLVFFDRPIGPDRELLSLAIDRRRDHVDFHPESVLGLVAGPGPKAAPWLVSVGQGLDTGEVPGPLAIARDLVSGRVVWQGHPGLATLTQPYGTALLTASEVLVPTREGIVRFARDDGRLLALEDRHDLDEPAAAGDPPLPYGNLVPLPGGGLLAVSATTVSCWRPER